MNHKQLLSNDNKTTCLKYVFFFLINCKSFKKDKK